MKKILIILSFAGIFSCSTNKESSNNPLDYLIDTKIIPIDRKTDTYTRTLQYVDGNLYWWNPNRETISIFDLSKKILINTIKIERDGPNGLGNPLGFYVLNADSIYIPTMAYELSLINSKGKWVADYDYHNYSKLGVLAASMTRYSNMIETNNAGILYLIIRDLEILSPSDLNEEALQNYPPILSFNTLTGNFEYLNFKTPSSLLKFKNFINFGVTATTSKMLLLNYQSNTLIEVDFNGIDYKEYNLDSELIKNFSNEYYNSSRMSQSIDENIRMSFVSSKNLGLYFDSYKNLLYRFGWPGEEIKKDEDPMQFSSSPTYFTISIYDPSDFSLIKEFILPRNTYLAHHYFVNDKGLNLFPMHPNNAEFNEDEMVIHTFDFSSLKP
ncbi:DUF4221 family protein [Algoriphagus yeomjeoni]|uniref:Uncharacterized protein DUF4221 n=1 Tax=Algoriphagus yeomjeoni TaxID=291403 RepID=A0A327PUV3_9BACT|nr:DUF4221 family protein [Algoriphagus yeomjeoni]RAI95257.1 uncharacterized protein DUF4221 [Algoriphagus yeomjeoni]